MDIDDAIAGDAADQLGKHRKGKSSEGCCEKMDRFFGKVCLFTISDLVEDNNRVRLLNVWAFAVVYIFFVLSLLVSLKQAEPLPSSLTVANPFPKFYFAGEFDEVRYFGKVPNRTQKIFVVGDDGSPMVNTKVDTFIDGFRHDGYLPCSTVDRAKLKGTIEARRTESVCTYEMVSQKSTDAVGIASQPNKTVVGPTGTYSFGNKVDANGSVLQKNATFQSLMSTPVSYLTVVHPDDLSKRMLAPMKAMIGKAFERQPAVYVVDADGLPVKGRKIRAFASPDPTWPPKGPRATDPPFFNRRGQKVVELFGDLSEQTDASGVARFTNLGVRGANVDSVNIMFSDSASVVVPWNDPSFSAKALYLSQAEVFRYPTTLTPRVATVEVIESVPTTITEGENFAAKVQVKDSSGKPVQGIPCYGLIVGSGGLHFPQFFERRVKGEMNKELLNAYAETGSDGIARFSDMSLSVDGNTIARLLQTPGMYDRENRTEFAINFNCDGLDQQTSPYGSNSKTLISQVKTTVAEVKILRVLKKSARIVAYQSEARTDSSDMFSAVVRVLDKNGNGVRGKNLMVYAKDTFVFGNPAAYRDTFQVAVDEESLEATNALGFAVVPFRVSVGAQTVAQTGSMTFKVRFIVDDIESDFTEDLTATLDTAPTLAKCNTLLPYFAMTVNMGAIYAGETDTSKMLTTSEPGKIQRITAGDIMLLFFAPLGETMAVGPCVSFDENQNNVNFTNCLRLFDRILAGDVYFRRRLEEKEMLGTAKPQPHDDVDMHPEEKEHREGIVRRLDRATPEDLHGNSGRARHLQSSDSSITLRFLNNYSTDADQWGRVPHQAKEPLSVEVWTNRSLAEEFGLPPIPTLDEFNRDPNRFVVLGEVRGPPGMYSVSLALDMEGPSVPSGRTTCYSEPILIEVTNVISSIALSGDGGAHSKFTHLAQQSPTGESYTEVTLKFSSESGSVPGCLFLANDALIPCGVRFLWVEAPFAYQSAFGMGGDGPGDVSTHSALVNDLYSVVQLAEFNATSSELRVGVIFHKRGVFGNFAIQFESYGIWSRVYTWRVEPPQGVKLEVIQAAQGPNGAGAGTNYVNDFFSVIPRVKVTDANDNPVDGAILLVEIVPEPDAVFRTFTELKGYSLVDYMYSVPSGRGVCKNGFPMDPSVQDPTCMTGEQFRQLLLGNYTPPAGPSIPGEPGVASWHIFTVWDGFGCARFKYSAPEGVAETALSEPICFEPSYRFDIVTQPSLSMPLNTRIGDLDNSRFVVQVTANGPAGRYPDLANIGFMSVRVAITNMADTDLDAAEADSASLSSLTEATCVFLLGKEVTGRCSELQLLQTDPFLLASFEFKSLTWSKVTRYPPKVKLAVSDLSLSTLDQKVKKPSGFDAMPSALKYAQCFEDIKRSQLLLQGVTTNEIAAELTPSAYEVIIPPPNVVTVGHIFLVRIQVRTASGSPLSGVRVTCALKDASLSNPLSAGADFLQNLAKSGDTIAVSSTGKAELDPEGTVRTSKKDGSVTFPLTIKTGGGGKYQIIFQPEGVGTKVVLTTAQFSLSNDITKLFTAENITEMRVEYFNQEIDIPTLPVFAVETASNKSLEELEDEGVEVVIKLEMKAASTKQSSVMKLVEEAKSAAVKQAKDAAQKQVEDLANSDIMSDLSADVAQKVLQSVSSKAVGDMSGLTDEYAEACMGTAVAGAATIAKDGVAAAASLSEAVSQSSDVIEPQQMLTQFMGTFTSGGQQMTSASDMKVTKTWNLKMSDIELNEKGHYAVKKQLRFIFQPDTEYAFTMTINGVTGSKGSFAPFKVLKVEPPLQDVLLNWFLTSIAGILCIIVLTTNTTKHHWLWFLLSILCTVGMIIGVQFMELFKASVYGAWDIFAYVSLGFLMFGLLWGLVSEKGGKAGMVTFEQKRYDFFEKYTKRKMHNLLTFDASEEEQGGLISDLIKSMKPFNEKDAFFFPSSLLIAASLAMLSFAYVLVAAIEILNGIDKTLNGLLHKCIAAAVNGISQMNEVFFESFKNDLPDSATDFMYKQIDLVKGWFDYLIDSIELGFTIGIVLAAFLTVASVVTTFVDFRQQCMLSRKGKCTFATKNAKVMYSGGFIGIMISSTILGFMLIVFLVTLITIPLSWPILWNMIWAMRETLWWVFIFPYLVQTIGLMVVKKLLFTDFFFKNRALGAIFDFYQTWMALLGGFMGAVTRFFMGLIGVLAQLPAVYAPLSPERLNKLYMLDTVHKCYLATLHIHCYHNNPIAITAAKKMLAIRETKAKFLEKGKKWVSSRSLVILLLMRFPELRRQRKHYLMLEREMAEAQKEREKMMKKLRKKGGAATDGNVEVVTEDNVVTNAESQKAMDKKKWLEKQSQGGGWVDAELTRLGEAEVYIRKKREHVKGLRAMLVMVEAGSARAKELEAQIRASLTQDAKPRE
eukprot:TRINITY_DN16743_c0_g2_i1.p1 TRINITY_DN16743_c0_g2~~TRINITY_DN16743_c0_g2_i1.p1  ORF type:complete len:2408 (-),score=436.36 TRINITY_DN16743_c0_g2_i1:52-7275(-)